MCWRTLYRPTQFLAWHAFNACKMQTCAFVYKGVCKSYNFALFISVWACSPPHTGAALIGQDTQVYDDHVEILIENEDNAQLHALVEWVSLWIWIDEMKHACPTLSWSWGRFELELRSFWGICLANFAGMSSFKTDNRFMRWSLILPGFWYKTQCLSLCLRAGSAEIGQTGWSCRLLGSTLQCAGTSSLVGSRSWSFVHLWLHWCQYELSLR